MKKSSHYINGERISSSEEFIVTKNPSTEEDFAKVLIGGAEEISSAIEAAQLALPKWRNTPVTRRVALVTKIAEWLEQEYGNTGEATNLKKLIHNEIGKPIAECDIEVVESADFVRYFCSIASDSLEVKNNSLDQELWPDKESNQTLEPLGVVAIIKPWNYPLEMLIWSVVPALLVGNTIVVKPSEKSTLTALELIKALEYAGIPKGVVNIVCGDSETGKLLTSSPGVNMISFTGSYYAGRSVAQNASLNLTRYTLELGGNDYAIVLDDCDIELTANGLVWGAFTNAGQVCVGVKQVLIHESVAKELTKKLVEKTKKLVLGRDIGPIVDEKQFLLARKYIDNALDLGASVLARSTGKATSAGYYFEPIVIGNLNDDMDVVQNECFAPVMPLHTFRDIEEAVSIVNRSQYGLGASIWSGDKSRVETLAHKLDVGMVWHNDVNIAFPSAPWGGRKHSGLGTELSPSAFDEYGFKKHICLDNSADKSRDWWYPY